MRIGIIGAMDVEVASLRTRMTDDTVTRIGGTEFHEGKIGSVPVVVAKCGVGKVNAAVCTQLLIDHFAVTHIINTGIAGSLNNDIEVGDAVISTDVMYHDIDVTAFGYVLGQVPGLPVSFEADETLRRMTVNAAASAAPDITVHEGRIVSGDIFVGTGEKKEQLRRDFGAECAEMEGAAIAQIAYLNGIPFVIVRLISDKATEETTVTYDAFEAKAADDSAHLLIRILESF